MAAQGNVGEDWDVFKPADLVTALGATRCWFGEVERKWGEFFGVLVERGRNVAPGFLTEVAGGLHPFEVHHQRQAVDDDVEEAAKEEAE